MNQGTIKALLFICLSLGTLPSYAQYNVDSLSGVLDTVTSHRHAGDIAFTLAYHHQNTDPDKALRYCEQALQAYRSVEDKLWEGKCYHLRYSIGISSGDLKLAVSSLESARQLFKVTESNTDIASVLLEFASLATTHEDFDLAYSYLNTAEQIIHSQDQLIFYADWNLHFGYWHHAQGHWNAAIPYFQKASEVYGAAELNHNATLLYLTNCYSKLKDFEAAEATLLKLKASVWESDSSYWNGQALHELALIRWEKGELEESINLFHQALPYARSGADRRFHMIVLNNAASVFALLGQDEQVYESLSEALTIKEKVVDLVEVGRTYDLIIEYWKESGDLDKALSFSQESKTYMMYASEYEQQKQQNKDREAWKEAISEIQASNQAKQDAEVAEIKQLVNVLVIGLVALALIAVAVFFWYRSYLQRRVIRALEAYSASKDTEMKQLQKSREVDEWLLNFLANRKR